MSSSSTASRLSDLIGLEGAKRVVSSMSTSQIQAHAILFYGSEGCGKEELADILSQSWLCTGPTAALDGADGTCPACQAYLRGRNPDVLAIGPQGPSNLIAIWQMQPRPEHQEVITLEQFIRTPPLRSRNKVVIIASADRMNSATSNALLKTLEEPPEFVKLILTTTSTGGIQPTILSRTLSVACSLPTESEIRAKFPEATPDDLLIAEHAPARIQAILNNPEPFREAVAFVRSLPTRRRHEALLVSEGFRAVSERYDSKIQCGMRAANAEVIRIASLIATRDPSFPPSWGTALVEAHERIIGNGQASLITDALFANLLV